jgi:hypothetical protein
MATSFGAGFENLTPLNTFGGRRRFPRNAGGAPQGLKRQQPIVRVIVAPWNNPADFPDKVDSFAA